MERIAVSYAFFASPMHENEELSQLAYQEQTDFPTGTIFPAEYMFLKKSRTAAIPLGSSKESTGNGKYPHIVTMLFSLQPSNGIYISSFCGSVLRNPAAVSLKVFAVSASIPRMSAAFAAVSNEYIAPHEVRNAFSTAGPRRSMSVHLPMVILPPLL